MKEASFLSVSQLNALVKETLEGSSLFSHLVVKGEISDYKVYSSGHAYFTLKDSGSVISAVMWSSSRACLDFTPKNGDEVICHGRLSVYPPRGSYQLSVSRMEQYGKGEELLRLQELARKLQAEGLFDQSRKRPLVKFPKRIGLITAKGSAAQKDMITNLQKRWPMCDIYVFPSLVQGSGAPEDLLRALNQSKEYSLDTLIIGRGGGSSEDLTAFNDEKLVRALAAYSSPTVSAVGHEIDFTLCDYVADCRVSTPTGAAVISVPDKEDIMSLLLDFETRMYHRWEKQLQFARDRLSSLSDRQFFNNPRLLYQKGEERVLQHRQRLELAIRSSLDRNRRELESLEGRLKALSPLSVLDRGYSISKDEKGNIVKSLDDIEVGSSITTTLKDGSIVSKVTSKKGD